MADGNDWDERELDPEDEPGWEADDSASYSFPSSGRGGGGGGGFRAWLPWLLWALLPLGLLLFWLKLSRGPASPAATEPPLVALEDGPEAPPPDASAAPDDTEPAIELPPLSESDAVVRESARTLSEHPFLVSVLGADDLARKFVVIVANIAEGASPKRQLAHVRPEERFAALQTSGHTVIDPESYHRYDPAAELFVSLDSAAVVKLYRIFDPLLEEAHRELGLSESQDFDDTLTRAMVVLLRAPVVEGPVPLRAVSVNYAFEDPRLERLSAAEKHLLRMGPENTRRIQKKIRELAEALGLELPRDG